MFSEVKSAFKGLKDAFKSGNHSGKPSLGKIRLGRRELEELNLISQGGYAYIYRVRDVNTGEIFALKQMICQSEERFKTAKNEIHMLRSLPNHPNLMQAYDSDIVRTEDGHHVFVLLELCEGGSLWDLIVKHEHTKLNEKQIIFIMREICEGLKVLHSMKPPVAHRDIKIENILLNNKKFKLCDFGSCSSNFVDFAKIPKDQYHYYEADYDKNCTLMYRPPEMCDPYQHWAVTEKVDVWMVGCICFTLCFFKHPFMEMTKLSIVNAAFTFPKEHPFPEKLLDIIRLMLTPNPKFRPSIFEMADIFENYFNINEIKLNPDAQRLKDEMARKEMEMKKYQNTNTRKVKQFEGDIPIEELMKIQRKIQQGSQAQYQASGPEWGGNDDDDDDCVPKSDSSHHFNNGGNNQRKNSNNLLGSNMNQNFDNFNSGPPNASRFKSSPGQNMFNDFGSFEKKGHFNSSDGMNDLGHQKGGPYSHGRSVSHNNANTNSFNAFDAFGTNNSTNSQKDNKVDSTWTNFNFSSGNASNTKATANFSDWSNFGSNQSQPQPQSQGQSQNQTQTKNDPFSNFSFNSSNSTNTNNHMMNKPTQQPQTQVPQQTQSQSVDLLGMEENKAPPNLLDLNAIKF